MNEKWILLSHDLPSGVHIRVMVVRLAVTIYLNNKPICIRLSMLFLQKSYMSTEWNGQNKACLDMWTIMKLSELHSYFDEGVWFGMIHNQVWSTTPSTGHDVPCVSNNFRFLILWQGKKGNPIGIHYTNSHEFRSLLII